MAQRRHPVIPGRQMRQRQDRRGGFGGERVAAHEPDIAVEGEIGMPRGLATDKGAAIGEAGIEPVRRCQRLSGQVRRGAGQCRHVEPETALAIGDEGLGQRPCRHRAQRRADMRHELRPAGPARHHLVERAERRRIQARLGLVMIERRQDRGGIAIDIGADLHDGCARIAAGQLDEVGLGHDVGDGHRLPGHAFQPEGGAHQFGKRRCLIFVKDGGRAGGHRVSSGNRR